MDDRLTPFLLGLILGLVIDLARTKAAAKMAAEATRDVAVQVVRHVRDIQSPKVRRPGPGSV